MVRHRLTDEHWELMADVFPPPAKTGRPSRDRREIVNVILWILRTGSPWRDLPEEDGPGASVWDLFNTWNSDGTLDEILHRLKAAKIDAGEIDDELWCGCPRGFRYSPRRHRGTEIAWTRKSNAEEVVFAEHQAGSQTVDRFLRLDRAARSSAHDSGDGQQIVRG